jgi:hypothetical protein
MATPTAGAVAVRFNLYGWPGLPLAAVAEHVARALGIPLRRRTSGLRGVYYRWTGSGAADVVVQANLADEEGALVEPGYPAHGALVYATGLNDAGYEALAQVEGLRLLDAQVVLVDESHFAREPTCRQ